MQSTVLVQFEIASDGLSGLSGYGGITQLADDRWALYKEMPLSEGRWWYAGSRGFVPPEEEISKLQTEFQEPARQIFHSGIQPRLSSMTVATLGPGEHYPRIWRGNYDPDNPFEDLTVNPRTSYGSVFVQSMTSATSLFDELAEVFKLVEPAVANLATYGHKLRQMLIIACTEIEANLRSIYLANFPPQLRTSTQEYVKLLNPMALDKFAVSLKNYPELQVIAPYRRWDDAQPTQSLTWYDAYNMVKHDREQNFAKATLLHVLEAMAALHVVLCAQWGPAIFQIHRQNYPSPFIVEEGPRWGVGDFYFPPIDLDGTRPPWQIVRIGERNP